MARKTFTTEQIIGMLREAEVKLRQGQTLGLICKGFGISQQGYYCWRRDYGGLKLDPAKRLKDIERENERLRKALAELSHDQHLDNLDHSGRAFLSRAGTSFTTPIGSKRLGKGATGERVKSPADT